LGNHRVEGGIQPLDTSYGGGLSAGAEAAGSGAFEQETVSTQPRVTAISSFELQILPVRE
jgi:hypothetical protein